MRALTGVSATLLALGGGIGACSSELTADDLAAAYRRGHPDIDEAVARCVVDALTLIYSIEQIEAQLARPSVSDDFAWEQYRSEAVCGSTANLEAQLSGLLVERGLNVSQAECTAAALAEDVEDSDLLVLRTGEMTDAFYARYFDALQTCEALP